jgi:hypothetical protein
VADPENFDFTLEDHIAGEVGERVRAIISAAEAAAAVIKQEAESEAQARRRLAESERSRYLEAARQEVDELIRQRVARLSELSDSLIEGAEQLLSELSDAQSLRRQLDRMVGALAQTAEELAAETSGSFAPARPQPAPEPEAAAPVPEPPVAEAVAEEPVAEEPAVEEPTAADEQPAATAEVPEEEPEPRRLRPAPAPEDAVPNGGIGRDKDDDTLAARLVALQMAVAGSPRGEVEEHLRVTFALDDTTSILNDVFGTETPPYAR